MKPFATTFALLVSVAALLLSGCAKTPTRPLPSDTMPLGLGGGGRGNSDGFRSTPVPIPMDGLPDRPGFDPNGQMPGEAVGLEPILFGYDKSDIAAEERPKLQKVAKYLQEHPDHIILFEGRCDWRGTAEYNLSLGDRRAAAAKKFVETLSIAPDRTQTLSKGSLDAPKNASEDQMKKDRRVGIIIVQKPR